MHYMFHILITRTIYLNCNDDYSLLRELCNLHLKKNRFCFFFFRYKDFCYLGAIYSNFVGFSYAETVQ